MPSQPPPALEKQILDMAAQLPTCRYIRIADRRQLSAMVSPKQRFAVCGCVMESHCVGSSFAFRAASICLTVAITVSSVCRFFFISTGFFFGSFSSFSW